MPPGFPRTARTILSAIAILALVVVGVGLTWYAARYTTETQLRDAEQRTTATVNGLAAAYAEQISRHLLAIDQTLETVAAEWESDPGRFDISAAAARARILTGLSRDMFLTDETGVIRQSTVPEFIGQSVGELEVFRDALEHANDPPKLLLGRASVNPIMRQWHLDAARKLRGKDGAFAGIVVADYRISAVNDVFAAASPPGNGFAALIGVNDGRARASLVASGATQDTSVADTPMFAAIEAAGNDAATWTGPTAADSVLRVHAFRRLPGRDLAVVAAIDQSEALQPVVVWQREARAFAIAITALIALTAVILLGLLGAGQRRAARARENLALLAAADARADVARAQYDVAARRLQATFAAVTDGVAIFDAHLNLVEWNSLFPERSGVNASFIRTGMPMEAVLRAQAEGGYFGGAADVEADVERRAALLRAGNFGASQTFQTENRVIELRCRPLPEGGFVALYTDVTEARHTRQALRETRETLRSAETSRVRFLGAIAHELRTRVATMLRSVAGFQATGIAAADEQAARLIDGVRRAGLSLANLAQDATEVPRMEAGALRPMPALFPVRPLLRECVDTVQPAARDLGITAYLIVNDSAPAELVADPARVRQIVTLLLSEALRVAAPDTIWLLVDGGENEHGDKIGLRLTIRCLGTPIAEAARAAIFPPLDAIAAPNAAPDPVGSAGSGGPGVSNAGAPSPARAGTEERSASTGLGPAIAQYLTTLMGGHLQCGGWSTIDGRTGNDFILTLPVDLLPGRRGRSPGQIPANGRRLPRTRILLAGAPTGLRLAAVTMLRRDGHMVDAVATGEEAVQALRLVPYDIAFMDTRLPDMTTETTMGVIREMSGPGRTVPVIAIAGAHEEIEARGWRDAGIDDVLTDPPTLDDFAGAIGRHVWLNRSLGADLGLVPGLEEETEDGVPILAAARIAELRANIQADSLFEMVEECIADLFHRLPALRRALAAGVPGAITAQAHAMVGMAGGYGMAVLEARLRAILTAARGQRLDTIDGAAEMIETDLTRTAAALRRMLRPGQPVGSSAPNP